MKEEESAQSPAPRCVKVQFCAFAEQIDEEELDSALEAERGRSSFMKRVMHLAPRRDGPSASGGGGASSFRMPSWTKQRRRSLRNTTSPNSNNIVPTRSCLRLRCPSSPTTEPSASARGVPPEVVQKAPTFKRKMSSGGDGLPTHLLPVLSCCSNCDAAWQYGRLPSACNSDDEDEDSTTTCSKTPARLHASKPTYHVHWTTNAKKLHDSCLGNSYSLASTTLPSATTCLSGRASAFADVDELDAVRRQGNALPSEGEESGINDERQDAPVLGRRWTSIESKEEVKKEFRKHRTRGMRKQGSSEHPQKGGTWQSATLEFLKSARVSSVYI